jgi:hypothetical protein
MFDKLSQFAEQAATNVSRRQFLGSLGRTAAGIAAVLGGVLLLPRDADAAKATVRYCKGQVCPAG